MKSLIISLIIPSILLFIAIWGLGEFHLQLWPFKMKLEKPNQLIGILFIVLGCLLLQKQAIIDTEKIIIKELEEAVQNAAESKINDLI